MCSVSLNVLEATALEDWAVIAKDSEINETQFSDTRDKFPRFLMHMKVSGMSRSKTANQEVISTSFLQLSPVVFFSEYSFLFCTA